MFPHRAIGKFLIRLPDFLAGLAELGAKGINILKCRRSIYLFQSLVLLAKAGDGLLKFPFPDFHSVWNCSRDIRQNL